MEVITSLVFSVLVYSQLTGLYAVEAVSSLPSTIQLCARNDSRCLVKSLPKALQVFKSGLPELELPALDPLRITDMNIDQGKGGPISMKMSLYNLYLKGFSDLIIKSAREEFSNTGYQLELIAFIPNMHYTGSYIIEGNILLLPIRGAGSHTASQGGIDVKILLTGHKYIKGEEEYIQVDNVVFNMFKVKTIQMQLKNLFDGNKALGDIMNKFMNENAPSLWRELQPAVERFLEGDIKNYVNIIFNKVPFKNIRPVQ